MTFFTYMETYELGFRHLSESYCRVWGNGEEKSVLGGSVQMTGPTNNFFGSFTVSISGGVGRFVTMVKVAERGELQLRLAFFKCQ